MGGIDQAKTSEPTTVRRPSNRRELILDAAVELFHRRGYHATSVDDIGQAVDVSGPAIYRHFSSKEEILVEAIKLAADEVHAVNRRAREESTDPRRLLQLRLARWGVEPLVPPLQPGTVGTNIGRS